MCLCEVSVLKLRSCACTDVEDCSHCSWHGVYCCVCVLPKLSPPVIIQNELLFGCFLQLIFSLAI